MFTRKDINLRTCISHDVTIKWRRSAFCYFSFCSVSILLRDEKLISILILYFNPRNRVKSFGDIDVSLILIFYHCMLSCYSFDCFAYKAYHEICHAADVARNSECIAMLVTGV